MALQPGVPVGGFEILTLLGSGGMGEVYRARDTKLNRDVAIKILPLDVASDPSRLDRFLVEAHVLAALNHPNIAQIYGIEDSQGVHALVMELVDGPTLADRIVAGSIPLSEALGIATQIARAIEAAHAQGIIHRDLKPANIKVRPDGTVKVLDFGIAKALAADGPRAATATQLPTVAAPGLTQAGAILGTAAYMSPEQARGRVAGKPADIWAFGCVLYEMLTGRSPFAGETSSDTIAKTIAQDPDWNALPRSTPRRIRQLLRRCLRKNEHERFQDIKEARTELERAPTARRTAWRNTIGVSLGAASLTLAIVIGARWYFPGPRAPAAVAPTTVLIADFENLTNDPTFDRTLEPVVRIALENATFVSAYDRTRINGSLGVRPPDKLDERAALELAVKQGLNVVVSGSISRQGNEYVLSSAARRTVSGQRIATVSGRASSKDQVLQVASTLMSTIRQALGDDTSDSSRIFAATTLSTASLDVVRLYAAAQEAASNGKFEEALQNGSKAVELDPKFGIGYQILAVASQNLGRHDDAIRYINEALRYLDGMTERERLSTRGMFFRLTGDYSQCEREYKTLSVRYEADVIGHNQRALCLVALSRMAEAVAEQQRAVDILPRRSIFRINLALYASYASEFTRAEREARLALEQGGSRGWCLHALAMAQAGQGLLSQAAETYRELEKVEGWASTATTGLAELAMYEGRFAEARKILADAGASALDAKNPGRAAAYFATLGHLESSLRRKEAAAMAITAALANGKDAGMRVAAARTLIELGASDEARSLMAVLSAERSTESQAFAKIIEADLARANRDFRQAVRLLHEANDLMDTWIGHFDLGRAYLDDGQFAQADSEFDLCIKRRGETFSLVGGIGDLPTVYYYQGRARHGLNTEGYVESYRRYLEIRGKSTEDPLLPEIRQLSSR
jgi:serine/threonine protein kinase/tetratricopeptide (TPR) repeat protein